MLYIVKKSLVDDPRIRGMLRPEIGETHENNVWSNEVRVDTWKAVSRRNPGHPWRHVKELYGRHDGETLVVAGAGPSLLALRGKSRHAVLAINRAILEVPAKYWLVHDRDCYLAWKDHPNAKAATKILCIQLYDILKAEPAFLVEVNGMPERWRVVEDRPLYWNECTLGWGLHLAIRMGAKRVCTIGTELSLEGQFDGFVQPGHDRHWQMSQHAGVRERMLEMFTPQEVPHWRDREVEIVDASGGELPVPKVSVDEIGA